MAKSKKPKKAHKAKTKPTKKAGKPAEKKARAKESPAGRTTKNTGASGGEATAGEGAGDESKALPNPQINVSDVVALQTLIEQLLALLPLLNSLADNAMGRLLATTSEIREREARAEIQRADVQQKLSLLVENQRPPARGPDHDAMVRVATLRWTLANQCRVANLLRPTPAIVGRAMHAVSAFDSRSAKSPFSILQQIHDAIKRAFGPQSSAANPDAEQQADHVHLTEEIVEVIEGRSEIPPKKQPTHCDKTLKPRLELLVNTGLADIKKREQGKRVDYSRFLTQVGREVFDEWPEWTDRTGGVSLAEEELQAITSSAATAGSGTPTSPGALTPGPSPPPSAT